MNEHELRKRFPNASSSTLRRNQVGDSPKSPEPEHLVQDESVGAIFGEEGDADGAVGCDRPSTGRVAVTITCYFTRPLDPDNCSVKHALDGLRYAGLIPDDRPQDIDLRIRQVKVAQRCEEKTVVTIAPAD